MQQHRPAGLLNGWPFVGVAAVAILAAVVAAIAITPDTGEAAARAVRLTARTSVTLFLAAFTAAALFRLWPNAYIPAAAIVVLALGLRIAARVARSRAPQPAIAS
ncbi:MAG: hypothetical protein ACREXP_04430 [Steroidobacteraceae bacterium]